MVNTSAYKDAAIMLQAACAAYQHKHLMAEMKFEQI
jgi:hypothetical protein